MMDSNMKQQFIPYDVLINILKRLPVKSLIRFKTVSKEWLHVIESNPHFTKQHLHHNAHTNTFLLLQRIPRQPPPLPFSSCLIGPDTTNVLVPQFSDIITSPAAKIVASCNGVLCVRDTTSLSLVNPATKQTKQVTATTTLFGFHYLGFGFTPLANDYKIVRLSMRVFQDVDHVLLLDDARVDSADVYSLAADCWTEIDVTNLRRFSLVSSSVAITGTVFWRASLTASDTYSEFVVSFDVQREIFTLLNGPPPPPPPTANSYSNVLAVCDDKLAMFRHYIVGNFESCSFDLWVLEESAGARERWVKMYSVGPFLTIMYPLSIWRNEVVCRAEVGGHENDGYTRVESVLSLFNPLSNELKNLPAVHRDEFCYVPFTYAESLVPVANINHGHA